MPGPSPTATEPSLMSDILDRLQAVLDQRRQADPHDSYVAALHHKGLNKILEKVGEEATETLLAAKDARSEEHTSELQSRPHLVCRLLLEKKKYNRLHENLHPHRHISR